MKTNRVAIIGAGLGGLSAAGVLARAGCGVTVFEASQDVGGKAGLLTAEGVTLDTGPTLLTMPDVVRETFAAVGATDLLPRFVELTHQCAYRYADGASFDVHRDLERTAESARALHPDEAAGVLTFYGEARALHRAAGEPYLEAPFEGMASFMSRVLKRGAGAAALGMRMGMLEELGRRHFRTAYLRQFVGRFATYAGASPEKTSAAFAMIPWLEHAAGVHHPVGGVGALAKALAQAVTRQGARLRLGQLARWEKRGAEWIVRAGEDEAAFDVVVVNADPLAELGRTREPLALSGYVLLLSVQGDVALPHHTVQFSRNYAQEFQQLFAGEVPTDPTVYVCNPAASDGTMAEPGRSGLFVMVNAPSLPRRAVGEAAPDDDESWATHAQRLRELCLRRLDSLVPGLGARAKVIGERTPVHLARLGAPGGSIYGFLPHGKLGPFRRPRIRGAQPGLFFAGGGTHPGGGVPLVMLSGRFAAQLALEYVGGAR